MQSLMSRHTVYKLLQTATQGASMGVRRAYSRGQPLTCTVYPKSGRRDTQQGQEAARIQHTLYFFGAHPGLDEQERILWDDSVMVITSPPRDAGGQGRFWVVEAETRTQDQADGVVID